MPKPPVGFDALIGLKTRAADKPYAVFRANFGDGDWTWRILKRYGGSHKLQARWFTDVSSPYTMGGSDLGDTYVADVIKHALLVEVEGHPPTDQELIDLVALRVLVMAQ